MTLVCQSHLGDQHWYIAINEAPSVYSLRICRLLTQFSMASVLLKTQNQKQLTCEKICYPAFSFLVSWKGYQKSFTKTSYHVIVDYTCFSFMCQICPLKRIRKTKIVVTLIYLFYYHFLDEVLFVLFMLKPQCFRFSSFDLWKNVPGQPYNLNAKAVFVVKSTPQNQTLFFSVSKNVNMLMNLHPTWANEQGTSLVLH